MATDLIERLNRAHGMSVSEPGRSTTYGDAAAEITRLRATIEAVRAYAKKASDNAWGGEYGQGIEITGDAILEILDEPASMHEGNTE